MNLKLEVVTEISTLQKVRVWSIKKAEKGVFLRKFSVKGKSYWLLVSREHNVLGSNKILKKMHAFLILMILWTWGNDLRQLKNLNTFPKSLWNSIWSTLKVLLYQNINSKYFQFRNPKTFAKFPKTFVNQFLTFFRRCNVFGRLQERKKQEVSKHLGKKPPKSFEVVFTYFTLKCYVLNLMIC